MKQTKPRCQQKKSRQRKIPRGDNHREIADVEYEQTTAHCVRSTEATEIDMVGTPYHVLSSDAAEIGLMDAVKLELDETIHAASSEELGISAKETTHETMVHEATENSQGGPRSVVDMYSIKLEPDEPIETDCSEGLETSGMDTTDAPMRCNGTTNVLGGHRNIVDSLRCDGPTNLHGINADSLKVEPGGTRDAAYSEGTKTSAREGEDVRMGHDLNSGPTAKEDSFSFNVQPNDTKEAAYFDRLEPSVMETTSLSMQHETTTYLQGGPENTKESDEHTHTTQLPACFRYYDFIIILYL